MRMTTYFPLIKICCFDRLISITNLSNDNTVCTFLINRLRIAFKWLIRAFSGFLASDQVLLLWDRILAYNSLDILPGKY